ncbi:MAG TPA: glycosyltransferase family 4 protein [Noviherbaspirillum sp.]|nr:glycosyltransferase family 4 protein [Noviherbaspirillum sp.]
MKIAQVSPLFESVPPKAYGGTERVVSYLTEALVRQGHEVTLFASGDSRTSARLVSSIEHSIRPTGVHHPWLAYHLLQMEQVVEQAASFDIIHFHTDYLHFPILKRMSTPHVTTLHGRLDLAERAPLYRRFTGIPFISISDHQRQPLTWVNWCATVYHGLPADLYPFQAQSEDYFVFVGRLSREKRIDRAIDIAKQCGVPLYIAAKLDEADEPYFNEYVKPMLRHPLVHYVGEASEQEKRELMGRARALLFPIDWPEPFGLVMIEAFSCGTPVIAYGHGSVPEIMEDGVTGFVVSNQDEAVRAARNIHTIDRKGCRQVFERRFTVEHMTKNYLRAYQQILSA